jgi:hypothetical protein
VIEKQFRADLYDGTAIDSAVKVYERFGAFELEKRDDVFVVRVTAKGSFDERDLADELDNFALGETIEKRGTARGAAS